jgi:hypothetical protein
MRAAVRLLLLLVALAFVPLLLADAAVAAPFPHGRHHDAAEGAAFHVQGAATVQATIEVPCHHPPKEAGIACCAGWACVATPVGLIAATEPMPGIRDRGPERPRHAFLPDGIGLSPEPPPPRRG